MTLGQIATQVQNGIYRPPEYYQGGHTLLRMYNLRNEEPSLDLAQLAQVTLTVDEYTRHRLRPGDLLISRVNSYERVGKCALVEEGADGYVCENMLLRIRLNDAVEPAFVAEQVMTRPVQDWIRRVARRAIGKSSINSGDVRAIPLRLPSLSKQRDAVRRINEWTVPLAKAVDAGSRQVEAISALYPALLRRALSGKA